MRTTAGHSRRAQRAPPWSPRPIPPSPTSSVPEPPRRSNLARSSPSSPHGPIDVRELDTDFLVTSVYKWFGPHQGALYGRREILDRLPAYKVRPAHDRFETGTQAFELIAGALAATDYLRDVGRRFG